MMNIQITEVSEHDSNSMYGSQSSLLASQTKLEHNRFKPSVFVEFFLYFLMNAFIGPFTYLLVLKHRRHGSVIAQNLHIYGGEKQASRTILWLVKLFCYITTFMLDGGSSKYEYDSISQFWLLIYTDISLAVLYGAYYGSFTSNEIKRLRTEVYDPGNNIFDKLLDMLETGKSRILDKDFLASKFPEIDVKNFYFIYPRSEEDSIPAELEPTPLVMSAPQLLKTGVVDGIAVEGQKLAAYILEIVGYQHFNYQVLVIKIISRALVVLRVILPVINNVYQIMTSKDPNIGFWRISMYIFQQGFYSFLIFKFVNVYDLLFLGLLLYKKKYDILSPLWEIIALKEPIGNRRLPKVCGSVPQNALAWLNVRRILAEVNEQAFVTVDTNMSFVLIYTLLFILGYFLHKIKVIAALLDPAQQFLRANPSLFIVIALTIIVVIVVILIDLLIGIYINYLFELERGQWMLHRQVTGNLLVKYELYLEQNYRLIDRGSSSHFKRLAEIQEFLGPNFKRDFYIYLRRLRNALMLTIDGITAEENYNPHTVLGFPINGYFFLLASTLISAIGITSLAQILKAITSGVADDPTS